MNSCSPLASNEKSPHASPTAGSYGSAPPGSLKRGVVAHLDALDFVDARDNVVFLRPPATGKFHLAISVSIRACQAGHRVLFATAAEWIDRLAAAHAAGKLHDELCRLGRYPLLGGLTRR